MSASNRPRVLLVRHARTALNAAGLLRGRLDPDLDDVGRDEAAALAEVLATHRPSRVVCSPLLRAVHTAQAIAERIGGRVVQEPRLIDRDYGAWAGRSKGEITDRWGSVDAAPGVEPTQAVLDRACIALDGQIPYLSEHPVVMVSHDAVNRCLLAYLSPDLGPEQWIDQRTACWNEIVHENGDWRVTLVDQKPPTPAPAR